jgi:hypothetical protein
MDGFFKPSFPVCMRPQAISMKSQTLENQLFAVLQIRKNAGMPKLRTAKVRIPLRISITFN